MICKKNITDLKTDIGEKIGQKVIVKGSLGRSKSFEKEATIEKAYSNIFVIKYNENSQNVTYSYTDVLYTINSTNGRNKVSKKFIIIRKFLIYRNFFLCF